MMKRNRTAFEIFTQKDIVGFMVIIIGIWLLAVAIVYFDPKFLDGNRFSWSMPILAFSGPVLIPGLFISIYFHQKKLDRQKNREEPDED